MKALLCFISLGLWLSPGALAGWDKDTSAETQAANAIQLVDAVRPVDAARPIHAVQPVDAAQLSHAVQPVDAAQPFHAARPVPALRPAHASHPVNAVHSVLPWRTTAELRALAIYGMPNVRLSNNVEPNARLSGYGESDARQSGYGMPNVRLPNNGMPNTRLSGYGEPSARLARDHEFPHIGTLRALAGTLQETGRSAPPLHRQAEDPWFGFDKIQHFTFSFLWTLGTQYVVVNKGHLSEGGALPISISTSAAVGLSKELYDLQSGPQGFFSYRDLVANAVGILLATGVILF